MGRHFWSLFRTETWAVLCSVYLFFVGFFVCFSEVQIAKSCSLPVTSFFLDLLNKIPPWEPSVFCRHVLDLQVEFCWAKVTFFHGRAGNQNTRFTEGCWQHFYWWLRRANPKWLKKKGRIKKTYRDWQLSIGRLRYLLISGILYLEQHRAFCILGIRVFMWAQPSLPITYVALMCVSLKNEIT